MFLVLVVSSAPRRWAVLGMMAGVLFLTQAQQINVAGFNLFAIRFLELAGFIRVMARGEFSFSRLNGIDRALLLFYGYTTVIFLLRSTAGVANQIGDAVDAFLCYFTFRGLVGDMDDLRWFLRAFVILLAPYVFLVLVERITTHNPFTLIGGVEGGSLWMRNGHPRCYGSFRQPDTLGMFGASFFPLYVGLACMAGGRKRAILGILLCLALAWAANSGGPAAGAAIGLVCWGFWRYRTEMRKVRWGIVGVIAALALAMKAPVWYIFARASDIIGGDGWHRSYLMDVTYRHLGQWWFAGMPISGTAGWFAYDLSATGGADITNQFIAFGLTAGLGAIVLFIVLLKRAFGAIGGALATVRSNSQGTTGTEFLLWGLGAMLVVHIINWFGISYFDQMYMVWFMQLAAVASITEAVLKQPEVEIANPVQFNEFCQHEDQPTATGLQGTKAIG